MKKLLLLTFSFLFFYCGNSYSADCGDAAVVDCALTDAADEIVMSDGGTVTITSSGSIIVDDHDNGGLIQLPASTSNLTITNDGTLQVGQYDGVGSGTGENNAITATGTTTNVTITNSGVIAASGRHAINLQAAEGDITITNNAGAIMTCVSDNSNGCVNLNTVGSTTAGDIKITNAGTIISQGPTHGRTANRTSGNSGGDTWSASRVSAGDYTGYSTISHHTLRLTNITNGGTITVDNSGTIESQACCALDFNSTTDAITATNSGTIKSVTSAAVGARGTRNLTLNNSGTITGSGTLNKSGTDASVKSVIDLSNDGSVTGGIGATIINSGTIQASGNNFHAISIGTDEVGGAEEDAFNNVTITNSGTIAGDQTAGDGVEGHAIRVYSDSTGTTINIKEEATFTGGVDLGKTESTIVLDSSITKDITMQVYNYDSDLTITNNLTGNDTYSITEEDLDGDGTADDGTLTILGEDLEIAQNNPKYRSENVLTKLRGLFDAANYINWHAPEDKFFKIFHSEQKREGTYKGAMSGVVGQLSPFILGDIRSNIFLGYTRQDGDFDNGEFLGGDNFALGLKSIYENNGFKASFTPMIGLNDLTITDFDTDTKTSISTNLLSEFAGFNTKFGKEIKTSEDSSLNLSFQSTLGLQRFPEYLAKFSDGDLSVDEAIEQVLGAGFEVRYTEELGKGFIIQPYIGANLNNNLNNSIKITADGENKNVSPAYETTTGYFAGVSFTKEAKDINFDLDLMYGNEDGLINQIAAVSLTKSFGQSETKTRTTKSDKDIRIASTMSNQDLLEFGELKELSNKLKIENQRLKTVNEKLKMLSAKVLEENKASKQLIVELLKENEKIKLEKEIFKNKVLENENKELLKEIEKGVSKNEVNRFALLLFVTILILIAYGLASVTISILKVSFKK